MKIKLVLQPNEFSSFTSYYLESLWREYFDIETHDSDTDYDKKSCLFVFNYSGRRTLTLAAELMNQGYKVVIDHLWEFDDSLCSSDRLLLLTAEKWFWFNESLWWRSLNYHSYRTDKQISKTAFMQIRRTNSARDYLIQQLGARLSEFLYSYKTVTLPCDLPRDHDLYQRYFCADWYNQTWMTLVVESNTDKRSRPFITEKTCKPLAYRHPFMIVGNPGSLACLRSWGFVTYDNLFDESYDSIPTYQQRLSAIINNLDTVVARDYDRETQQRLEHNYNHYFNAALAVNGIVNDVINPILEFAA